MQGLRFTRFWVMLRLAGIPQISFLISRIPFIRLLLAEVMVLRRTVATSTKRPLDLVASEGLGTIGQARMLAKWLSKKQERRQESSDRRLLILTGGLKVRRCNGQIPLVRLQQGSTNMLERVARLLSLRESWLQRRSRHHCQVATSTQASIRQRTRSV